ncbi:unnamed protein product [Ilex paraguariensis]|uniref:Cytochrome P450 n=1 Tax=Ilex paraguariensis TaxID=185542 RepID=A0ABC8QXZ6_9AQUA
MAIFPFTKSWLPLLLLLSLPFLYLCLLYPKKKAGNRPKLPPSPPRLPVIGNLYQLGKLPHQSLRQLSQKYGPVMLLQLGNSPTLVISSADMAKEVLKTHDVDFCSRPPSPGAKRLTYNFSDMAFTPYSDHWREMRRIFVTGLLNPRRAQSFRQAREVEMNNMINSLLLASPSPVDLDEQIYSFMDGFLGTATLGKSYRRKQFKGQNLKDVVEEAMRMMDGFSAEDFFPWIGKMVDTLTGQRARLEKCFSNLDGYFRMMLEEHLHHERPKAEYEDFVDVLVRLSKDETGPFRLTNDRMKGILLRLPSLYFF